MTLNDWLSETGMKRGDLAKALGVVPSYVTLLCSEKPAWPGRDVAERIRTVTEGKVTADDFLPTTEAASAGASA